MVYKQLVKMYEEMYEEVVAEYVKDYRVASIELFRRGAWLGDALSEGQVLKEEVKKLRNQVARLNHEGIIASKKLEEAVYEEGKAKRESDELQGRILQSEVKRERDKKALVEHREKWKHLAEKREEETKKMGEELRTARKAAKRAPSKSTDTQTQKIPLLQHLAKGTSYRHVREPPSD